jgi:PPOX class probable F420-dependent enzyme
VNIVVDGNHAYFRTFEEAGKFKRLLRNPEVVVAPSTVTGTPTGDGLHATARLLEGVESERAARLIDQKHPFFQGLLVRLGHRLYGFRTRHFELRMGAS